METINNSYHNIKEKLINVLITSNERTIILSFLNNLFKEMYISGEVPRFIIASISPGKLQYRHSMSTAVNKSALLLTVQNDDNLSMDEVEEISSLMLWNKSIIRQLMVLGFDTLTVKGKLTQAIQYRINDIEEIISNDNSTSDLKTNTPYPQMETNLSETPIEENQAHAILVYSIIVAFIIIIVIHALSGK